MPGSVVVDAGFLVALLSRRDAHHEWAIAQAVRFAPTWSTCDAALAETYHLVGPRGAPALGELLRRRAVRPVFELAHHLDAVLKLLHKYADVPMSLADACLVRMTEVLPSPVLLTTNADFRIYRRHSRQVVPCVRPS